MLNSVTRKEVHRVHSISLAVAVLAAVLFAFTAPAFAHGGGHSRHAPRGVGHGHDKTVPRVIAIDQRGYYNPYLAGRVYYAPHHHHHARYLFPVYVNGAVVYQPYFYCGSQLFVSGAVALPQLAVGVNFASPGGFVIGGYYSPLRGYRAPYADVHGQHHHCDEDWDE